jgi:hypothetical protein
MKGHKLGYSRLSFVPKISITYELFVQMWHKHKIAYLLLCVGAMFSLYSSSLCFLAT